MPDFAYPYTLERQHSGELLVTFPDIPEAITFGLTEAEAHVQAADCLRAAAE